MGWTHFLGALQVEEIETEEVGGMKKDVMTMEEEKIVLEARQRKTKMTPKKL